MERTTVRDTMARLVERLRKGRDLSSAAALLAWDQETGMPKKGIAARSRILATLAAAAHDHFVSPETGELLLALESCEDDLDESDRALLREVRRDHARATRVPTDLVRATAEATSRAQAAWQQAREERAFPSFAPHLETLLRLREEAAQAIGFEEVPLDALIDEFEPGETTRSIERMFSALAAELAPMVQAVRQSDATVDTGPLRRNVAEEIQLAFARQVASSMGFDFDAGRMDRSAHPFCTGIHEGDVRITWRGAKDDMRPLLFGVIHEAGHGLYEQGLEERHHGTPLGEAVSLGVHESQSRLWENMIARSRAFWIFQLPRLKAIAPGVFDDVDTESMYRASNEVAPSLIRVEADELTYNLHIVLRFELERALFSGDLSVGDLPGAFSDGMERLLGIRPAHDGEGVLQDIHWSMGAFGYFPTYTIGNLYAAELLRAADRDLGGIDARIEAGDYLPLREWLRDKVHRHGRRFPPRELIRRACGREPGQDAFLDYMRGKLRDVYGV